jgi:mono/diheme cytochrome c family protein
MSAANPQVSRERPEPVERRGPLPTLFLVFIGALAAFGANYLVSFSGRDASMGGDQRSAIESKPKELSPEQLFRGSCASCHQETGLGIPGAFPPLAGSPWVLDDERTIARILLLGIEGPIEVKGATFNGQMPRFDRLTDRDLSALATYVRSSWGNQGAPIDPKVIAEARKELSGRTSSWKGGAELRSAAGK